MARKQSAKLAVTKRGGISGALAERKPPSIDGVVRGSNGLLKVDQLHNARFNLVLPEQLLDAFTEIAERTAGKRERSAVVEHLIIGYCKENGAQVNEVKEVGEEVRGYHTAKEAANLLRVDIRKVREYIKEGRLEASKVGRAYLIKDEDLAAFVESCKEGN